MTVIATDSPRLSGVVKYEFDPSTQFCRDKGIINDSAQTIKVGTVMGKVTATGKWKVCQTTAGDGSQTPAGVYIADYLGQSFDTVLAAATDTNAIIMVRGPVILGAEALVYAASNAPTALATKTAFAALNPPMLVEPVL